MTPLELYHLILLGGLLAPLSIALFNSATFPRLHRQSRSQLRRSVSVLIPARNEEETIGGAVRSLLQQSYHPLEIIVLDDQSEDRTRAILEEIAQEVEGDRKVHTPDFLVVEGSPLPDGWLGKNHACHKLAQLARGEILVFIDADTLHDERSIEALVSYAEESGSAFVSAVPRQLVPTFWEALIVPMAPFLYFSYLPNRLISRKNHPSLSAANGQMILVTRDAYNTIGGHEAIRNSVVDDVDMARRAKELGVKIDLVRADRTATCRMYRTLPEILSGFSKNLFPGLGESTPLLLLFLLHMILFYLLPPIFLLVALIEGASFSSLNLLLPCVQVIVGFTIRSLTASAFGMNPVQGGLQPLSALGVVVVGLNSFRLYRCGTGGEWKGRTISRNR